MIEFGSYIDLSSSLPPNMITQTAMYIDIYMIDQWWNRETDDILVLLMY